MSGEASLQKNIIWLASYPKSGNTWFRAFLTALLNEGELDINNIESAGIFSSRQLFEIVTDLNSYYFSDDEIKNMMPNVFRAFVHKRKKTSFIKIHDAFSYNLDNVPIVPEDVTECAIYIVRNPLDVVASLGNHLQKTTDEAISMMNSPNAYMGRNKKKDNIGMQFSQLLYSWSGHVLSWLEKPAFPVYFVRYEDMHEQPFETFKEMVGKLDMDYSDEAIMRAIEASSFKKLKEQETNKGFVERPYKENSFFRKGTVDGWKEELTAEQVKRITDAHASIMERFGYAPKS